ncbi:amino acid ABC transporter permease, partial [Streptomyces sp. NPDC046821]
MNAPPSPETPESAGAAKAPEAIKAIPVRHFGRYVAAVVAIGVLVAIVYA